MAGSCKGAAALEAVEQEYFFWYSGVHDHRIFAFYEVAYHQCHVRTPSGRTDCPRGCLIGRLTHDPTPKWRPVGLFH